MSEIIIDWNLLQANAGKTPDSLEMCNRAPGLQTHLQDVNVGNAVGAVAAAVDLDVFQPLDVRLSVAVNLTVELHVAAHHYRLIGWQARLEDGSVRGALWERKTSALAWNH